MQRKKTQRRFTQRGTQRRRRFGTMLALVLLMLLGVSSFLSSQTASARNTPTPTPGPGETRPPFDPGAPVTAASMAPADEPSGELSEEPSEEQSEESSEEQSEESSEEQSEESSEEQSEEPSGTAVLVHSVVPVNPMNGANQPEIIVEEPEWGPLAGVKVGIDPGHQAHSNSAQEPVAPGSSETKAKVSSGTAGVRTRIAEYEINLQIALLLRTALEAQGAEVYMTREINDVDISNIERAMMMNGLGVDVVLRLHCNGSDDQSANGIGLFVKSGGDGAAESYAISETLIAAMGEATGAHTEPIHVRDNYSGLNWSTVPSILVEMGYQSNPEEDEKLASPEYQALLVEGMVKGLTRYFAEHPVPTPTPEPTETPAPAETPKPSPEPRTVEPEEPTVEPTEEPDTIGE